MQDISSHKEENSSEYLYSLLKRIKERPGLYLGRSSITRLRMLLAGYNLARRELNLPITVQEKEFDRFQAWIEQRFNISSTQGWDSIILFHSTDEREALEKFFKLFEQFRRGENSFRDD